MHVGAGSDVRSRITIRFLEIRSRKFNLRFVDLRMMSQRHSEARGGVAAQAPSASRALDRTYTYTTSYTRTYALVRVRSSRRARVPRLIKGRLRGQ